MNEQEQKPVISLEMILVDSILVPKVYSTFKDNYIDCTTHESLGLNAGILNSVEKEETYNEECASCRSFFEGLCVRARADVERAGPSAFAAGILEMSGAVAREEVLRVVSNKEFKKEYGFKEASLEHLIAIAETGYRPVKVLLATYEDNDPEYICGLDKDGKIRRWNEEDIDGYFFKFLVIKEVG